MGIIVRLEYGVESLVSMLTFARAEMAGAEDGVQRQKYGGAAGFGNDSSADRPQHRRFPHQTPLRNPIGTAAPVPARIQFVTSSYN
jgi:hypothetical protein